jgi:hypothetical protein
MSKCRDKSARMAKAQTNRTIGIVPEKGRSKKVRLVNKKSWTGAATKKKELSPPKCHAFKCVKLLSIFGLANAAAKNI